jgi:hypothetical protein
MSSYVLELEHDVNVARVQSAAVVRTRAPLGLCKSFKRTCEINTLRAM